MRMPFCGPRRQPPWWPETEPWPPRQWRMRRGRPPFMWRFALFALFGMGLMLAAIITFASRAPQSFLLVAGVFLIAWAIAVAGGATAMRAQRRDHDRMRRDMMADIAHELRTPLTVMQGTLEGMLDGVYPRDERRVEQLLDETKVLGRLVEDLRTLTLSESGALTLQTERVDLASLAREVASGLGSEASAGQVSIDVVAGSPPAVDADPVRLRQVIANLVANAIRATPPGGRVTVRVGAAGPNASLSVSDTGRGMTRDELARIFERFYKGADSRGSGLGLTIARNIVRLHRGEMQATSERGAGTTVGFTLPGRA